MDKIFKSDISIAMPGALIPPIGIILLYYGASHYLYLNNAGDTEVDTIFQGLIAFFSFPLIIAFTQYRLESESEYTLVFEPRGISLFEKFQDDNQKLVGFIHKDNIETVSCPEHESNSWFFYWVYFSLKFLRLQHLLFSKNIVIEASSEIDWPTDLTKEHKHMIPFYFEKQKLLKNELQGRF